jgi:hypothetical protein
MTKDVRIEVVLDLSARVHRFFVVMDGEEVDMFGDLLAAFQAARTLAKRSDIVVEYFECEPE